MFTEPDIAVVNVWAAVLPLSGEAAGGGTEWERRNWEEDRKGKGKERETRSDVDAGEGTSDGRGTEWERRT